MIAVITADLINSTAYPGELLAQVLKDLKQEFLRLEKDFNLRDPGFEISRGDSFQGMVSRPEMALAIALRLKCTVLRNSQKKDSKTPEADLRIAIGIGSLDYKGANLAESNGQAFQFSGRTLDQMKGQGRKIRLMTPDLETNKEFEVSLFLFEEITDRWSIASAEVIYFLLKDWKEKTIANSLEISQSAVNQRKKAAGWEAVQALLNRYKAHIAKKFPYE